MKRRLLPGRVSALVFALGCILATTGGQRLVAADAAPAPAPLRIALLSDTHTNRGTKEDQPLYRARLDKVIASVNAQNVDVILIAGDLTQDGKPEEAVDFKAQVKGFKAPVLWSPGNHDIGAKLLPGKAEGPKAERVAAFEAELGPSYFVRTVAGVRVVGVNSPVLGSGLNVEKEMWMLLEKELAQPAGTPTVLFMHYPLFVKTADEAGGGYWNVEPEPRARLLALVKRGGVRAVLTGHLHYQLVNHYEGVLLMSTAPVSFGLPRTKAMHGWTLVTLPRDGEPTAEFQKIHD